MTLAVAAAEALVEAGALPETEVTARDLLDSPPEEMLERARTAVREAMRGARQPTGRERR